MGLATWKEVEVNQEADKRAVQAAHGHAILEIGVENYKVKAQQTKLMQLTLIEIHKERFKQHKIQQSASVEQEEWDRQQEYDPWADDEEYDRRRMMKECLGDAMHEPEKALPRFCCRKQALNNDGRGRWQLPTPPTFIGQAEKHSDRKKENFDHNPWPYSPGLFEPLYWF